MNRRLLKRRVAMFDLICKGCHPSTVISQLAEEFKVSEQCLWSDWQRRDKWLHVILSFEKYGEFIETVESKLNAVQKAAWSLYTRADNDSARVGALRVILDSLEVYFNNVLTKQVLERLRNVEEQADKKNRGARSFEG